MPIPIFAKTLASLICIFTQLNVQNAAIKIYKPPKAKQPNLKKKLQNILFTVEKSANIIFIVETCWLYEYPLFNAHL